MSLRDRLLEELMKARVTGKKAAYHGPLRLEEDFNNVIAYAMDEYDLKCIIGAKYFLKRKEDMKHVIDMTVKEITNFLFRDARTQLLELERAYWNHDDHQFKIELDKMWKELE